jgi:hypothetical protein
MPYKRPPNVDKNHWRYGVKHTEESKQKMRKPRSEAFKEKCRNRPQTKETREKISKSRLGELNPIWKGDEVGYDALHAWVRRRLPKPKLCQRCNLVKPRDLANVTGNYTRDFENWQYLCRKCHMATDDRLANLRIAHKAYYDKVKLEIQGQNRICNVCHQGSELWFNDVEGYICAICYSLIRYYRIRPIKRG